MSKLLQLTICGNGALAKAFLDFASGAGPDVTIFKWETAPILPKEIVSTVGIHVGSGKQLPDFIAYCEKNSIPLIQASTGMTLPEDFKIPIINAPNLALPIIAFLKSFPAFIAGMTKGIGLDVSEKRLLETHQNEKKSVPGTAKVIADVISIPHEEIVSVRKKTEQSALGVPHEHLNRHAYHFWDLRFASKIEIGGYIKVQGLGPYVDGGIILARRVVELSPIPGPLLRQMTEFI